MPQAAQKKKPRKRKPPRKKTSRRRRWWIYASLAAVAWLGISHYVVRARMERFLAEHFTGRAHVAWALLLPNLDAVGFGARIEGEHFTIDVPRVHVDILAWSVFGADPVLGVTVAGLEMDIVAGQPLRLLRERVYEGAPVPDDLNLDPVRLPPVTLRDVTLRLSGTGRVFSSGCVTVAQVGDPHTRATQRRCRQHVQLHFGPYWMSPIA